MFLKEIYIGWWMVVLYRVSGRQNIYGTWLTNTKCWISQTCATPAVPSYSVITFQHHKTQHHKTQHHKTQHHVSAPYS